MEKEQSSILTPNNKLVGVKPSKEEPKSENEFDKKLAEDKAKKESASKVQDASQQFDDLFNN